MKEECSKQKWIVFTDFDEHHLENMCRDLDLIGAEVKNLFINDIYRLDFSGFKKGYEKSVASVFPRIIQEKQTILLGHYHGCLDKIHAFIKEYYPELKCEVYNTYYHKKATESLEKFKRGELQVLLAALGEVKKIFKRFIQGKENILMGLNICDSSTPYGKMKRTIDYSELIGLRLMSPKQKWIVFTDYRDDELKKMRNKLCFNNAKIKDGRGCQDIIYRVNHNQVDEKIQIYGGAEKELNPFQGKQAILFIHHPSSDNWPNMASNVNELRNRGLELEMYDQEIAQQIREHKEWRLNGRDFQFLLATPNMYEKNEDFRECVHEQIVAKDIIIGV